MPRACRRKRRTEPEWAEILRRFHASELSPREFCRREGLAPSSFQRWRSRLGRVAPTKFVEVVPGPPDVTVMPEWSLDIALPNGTRLRFRG